jgi:glucose-6-phosphate isomerase
MASNATPSPRFTDYQHWHTLSRHFEAMQSCHMRELFAADPQRFESFSLRFNDILFDYSKNIVSGETLELLCGLAREAGLEDWIRRMFAGEKINHTEDRAVLHPALRATETTPLYVDGEDVRPKIQQQLARVEAISEAVRSRRWRGVDGQAITDVVNIGIGGSDLGPKMVIEALHPYALHDLNIHFVSNLDENHILDTLERLKPSTTLFIVSSKSFTTQDTLLNADTAREWFLKSVPDQAALQHHFLAVTANPPAAEAYGIHADSILEMWDWVGGRYSLWSAIGVTIAIALGMEHFRALLAGAAAADEHFRTTPLAENIPVVMGLLGIWYNNFFGAQTHAVLPYDEHMRYLPGYLQQADMESNGKSVDRAGRAVDCSTGPVIFGEIGIKGQHAFYQLLHQGTKLIPTDFLAAARDYHCIGRHHRALMANVFAQTEALMKGKTAAEAQQELAQQGLSAEQIAHLLPYKIFQGNKPSNTFLFKTLDPQTLGTLIAFYEHKIFVQGVIWNINSFDQWGVELGKQLAKTIGGELEHAEPITDHDASTNGLINYYKSLRSTEGE